MTAAAELGQSEDPKALVPGNPEAIEGHARALVAHSEHFDTVAQDLGKVDVPGWTGVAGSAFLDTFSKEPPKWTKVCDALTSAGSAVSGYAGTLSWTQSQADEAIALWKLGEAATKQATSAHDQAVANADAQNKAAVADGTSAAAQVAPFSDPGEALRKQAREMLDRARKQLKAAGETAAGAISGAPAQGTTASSAGGGALDNLVNAVTGGMWVAGKAQASGPKAGFEMSGPKDGKLGELKAYAELAKASAEGSISNQFLTIKGKAEAGIGAEATAAASFTNKGLKAKVEASAGAKASAEYRVDAGPLGYGAKAEGFAGAQAGAGLTAGKDGLEAKWKRSPVRRAACAGRPTSAVSARVPQPKAGQAPVPKPALRLARAKTGSFTSARQRVRPWGSAARWASIWRSTPTRSPTRPSRRATRSAEGYRLSARASRT